jgi:CRP-like cAMP-binding protein
MESYGDVLSSIPFFNRSEIPLVKLIVRELQPQVYLRHSVIFEKGDFQRDVYILKNGKVRVLSHVSPRKCPPDAAG